MSKQDAGKDVKPFQSLDIRTHVGSFHFNVTLTYPVRIPGGL
jgi:hypothetical protein